MDNQQQSPQQPAHRAGGMTFGSKTPAPSGSDPELYSQLANVTRRVRIIEESVSNIRKKSNIDEENNLDEIKKLHLSVKSLFAEIGELKKEQDEFKNEMRKMISEFQTVAKKDELEVLKKYIKIWEPVQFATVNQVEKMIAQANSSNSFEQPNFTPPPQPEENPVFEEQSDEEQPEQENDAIEEVENKFEHSFDPTSQYVKSEELDTTPEEEAASQGISDEKKKKIAALIEEYDDVRDMILHKPHEFEQQIQSEPELSKLFSGVNIIELSKKLKPHYEN